MADDEIDLIWVRLSVARPENLHRIDAIRDVRDIAGLRLLIAKQTIEQTLAIWGGGTARGWATIQIMRGDFHGFARRMEEYGFAVEALDL